MQKLNILWIASSHKKGLLYHAVLIAKAFKKRGHNVVVLSSNGEQVKGLFQSLKQADIPFYVSDYTDKKTITSIFKASRIIRKIVKDENINVIQANGFYHLLKSCLAIKNTPLKNKIIIGTYLHAVRHGSRLETAALIIGSQLLNRCTDIAMPVSVQEKDKMVRFGLNPEKAAVVYVPVDFETFQNNLNNLDNSILKKYQIFERKGPVITYLANLIPRKGHKYLLYAIPKVLKQFPQAKFIFAGDDEGRNRLDSIIKWLNITDNVIITGRLDNKYIPKILSCSDIAVVTSLSETYCHAIIEPMAAGVPVVTTPVGIAPEIIEDNKTGKPVPMRNPEKTADAILYLLNNRQQAMQIGLASKELVKERFNIETIIKRFENLYLNELAKKNGDFQKQLFSEYQGNKLTEKQTVSA